MPVVRVCPELCCKAALGRAIDGVLRFRHGRSVLSIRQNLHFAPVIRELATAIQAHHIRSGVRCGGCRPPRPRKSIVIVRATEQDIKEPTHIPPPWTGREQRPEGQVAFTHIRFAVGGKGFGGVPAWTDVSANGKLAEVRKALQFQVLTLCAAKVPFSNEARERMLRTATATGSKRGGQVRNTKYLLNKKQGFFSRVGRGSQRKKACVTSQAFLPRESGSCVLHTC